MKGNQLSIYAASLLAASAPLAVAQRPQIPFLTAMSLRRGEIISEAHTTRVAGDVDSYQATDGICAVKVQLRTFGRLVSPYEVQCFFCAKSPQKPRYVYDAVKVLSAREFDDITFIARNLFARSEHKHVAITTGYDLTGGQAVPRTWATINNAKVEGSNVEGWIVRVVSGGYIVRVEASLPELKDFADREALQLDRIASNTNFSK